MLKVGVIGVGYLGQHHARIFSKLSFKPAPVTTNEPEDGHIGIRLVAVADLDIRQAEKIAKNYGCRSYHNYRDMLDRVDALSIVTPTTSHYEIAMDCIMAGKDILIEKPITTTVKEADELIDASKKVGTIIQVGHLERFNSVFLTARKLINNPVFIETERLSPFLGRGIDVDVTLDLMIHDIDIVFALMPASGLNIKDIKATGASVLTDNIDIAKVWLEFDNGTQALMTASRISFAKSRKLKIFQKDSCLFADYQDLKIKRFFKEGDKVIPETINVEKKEPLMGELKDFVSCVMSRHTPVVSAIEGRNALKIAFDINNNIRR